MPAPQPLEPSQQVVMPECPLCEGTEASDLAVYSELTWVRCRCGLIYKRSEQPDPQSGAFYESGYFGAGEQGRRYDQRTRRRIAKSRNQILDLLNHAPPGPLLDVGCSLGYTLQAARDLGLPAAGADLSEHAVAQCRALGFRAERGPITALPFRDGEFALATLKHVLEHTPQPRSALRELRRVLQPGGGLFIAIPHAGYRKAVRNPQASRYYLPEAHGREHFVYYTPQTLTWLLEQEGFTVKAVHPALLHRHATALRRTGEALVAPLRFAAQQAANALQVRKEFWLVAVKAGSTPPQAAA